VGQKALLSYLAKQTGLPTNSIPRVYRSYTCYDQNHKERGSVVKQEMGDTEMLFRIHPGKGADDNDPSIIKASAKKEMASKLYSLALF